MPELPEVETTLRGISPHICGEIIEKVIVRNANLRWKVDAPSLQRLAGHRLLTVTRRAKYLILSTDKTSILLHLGMSGNLRVVNHHTHLKKHDHIDIVFKNKVLRYNDARRFGCCLCIPNDALPSHTLLAHLGPEPLKNTFSPNYLFLHTRNKKGAIKNAIMNNKLVVGVGNIYASEALFLAGIHPKRSALSLDKQACAKLTDSIKTILKEAIIAGGTSLKDFVQADGKPGYFTQQLWVYGRNGQTCEQCSSIIQSEVIGQRNSFYCPNCQT